MGRRLAYQKCIWSSLLLFGLILQLGCSTAEKSADQEVAPAAPVEQQSQGTPSEGEILGQYSYLELNSAANFLTVIFDRSLEQKTGEALPTPDALNDCQITGDQARDMLMPLKALIDVQVPVERDAYKKDQDAYAAERAFESCGRQCNCGPLATVVEGVYLSAFKKRREKTQHQKYQVRLQAKAERLLPHEKLTCARKAEWFCSSQLRVYLESRAAEGP